MCRLFQYERIKKYIANRCVPDLSRSLPQFTGTSFPTSRNKLRLAEDKLLRGCVRFGFFSGASNFAFSNQPGKLSMVHGLLTIVRTKNRSFQPQKTQFERSF